LNVRHAFPGKYIEATDVQQLFPHGTVVTVESWGYQDVRDGDECMYLLSFREMKKPVVLRKTNALCLAEIFGSDEMDDWIGKTAKMFAMPVEVPAAGGRREMKMGIRFMSHKQGERPTLAMKSDLTALCGDQRRAQLAASRATAASSTTLQPAIGTDAATAIIVALELRGKDWNFAAAHLASEGLGHLCSGKLPPEVPGDVLPVLRRLVGGLPKTKQVDVEARESQLRASWAPPAAVSGQVVDRTTGEVLNDSDIQF
jgi:hypothetical protein